MRTFALECSAFSDEQSIYKEIMFKLLRVILRCLAELRFYALEARLIYPALKVHWVENVTDGEFLGCSSHIRPITSTKWRNLASR